MKNPFEGELTFHKKTENAISFYIDDVEQIVQIYSDDDITEGDIEKAKFIVHALNKHDALVEACRLMIDTAAPSMIANMAPKQDDPVLEGLVMVLGSLLDNIKAVLKDEPPEAKEKK